MPRASASSRDRPSTLTCASDRFWRTLKCGNSSKCWNTIPTRARSLGRLVFGSLTLMPSTWISPCCTGSRALTALISVDFPEPDGPQTTITSPLSTLVVQSVSTWKLPYHLETLRISIIGIARSPRVLIWLRDVCLQQRRRSADDRDPALQALDEIQTCDAYDEVHQRREHVHLDEAAIALGDLRRRAEEVGDRQHVDERGVLEHDDRLGEQDRQHVAECLRQHDPARRLPVIEAQCIACPDLAA